MIPRVIRGRLLDLVYELVIDDPEIADHLQSVYRDSITSDPGEGGVHRSFELSTTERGFALAIDGVEIEELRRAHWAVGSLCWQLHRSVTSVDQHSVLLHAGAVEREGRVVVLVGASGEGKTTATLALVRRGFRYITDDITLVTPSGEIRGAAKPVGIREPTPSLLGLSSEELGAVSERLVGESSAQLQVAVSALGGEISMGGRPALVVLLGVGRDAQASAEPSGLSPLRRSEALAHLVEASPDLPDRGRDGFGGLANLVRSVECFTTARGNLDTLCAELDAALRTA